MPMTLWSRLKIYLRIKPVGGWWWPPLSCVTIEWLLESLKSVGDACLLLQRRFLIAYPLIVIRLRNDIKEAAHAVVTQATQLGAGNFILALHGGVEMHMDHHARHGIL